MYFLALILVSLSLLLSVGASMSMGLEERARYIDYRAVCREISKSISATSRVYYPADPEFLRDITGWSATNVQQASCTVEPTTSQDVSVILKIVGARKVKFAIKSGGHSPNPGFSSTKGVLISMRRFSKVKYSASSKTVVIGSGLTWDNVYAALSPYKVSVLGARVSNIGVGGFLLGGGYSFKSNQYGLAIDTVISYELIKPTGEIVTVTETSHPDLFFGLKGGLNNFGIVTKFTLKTFPQTDVWGGMITYDKSSVPALRSAITAFNNKVKDPKASVITSFNFSGGKLLVTHVVFYDGPVPPKGMFDSFFAVRYLRQDVSRRSLLSLIQSIPSDFTDGQRNTFATLPVQQYTPAFIDAIVNEAMFWGQELQRKSATLISYTIEPVSPSILSHNMTPTAYPADRSHVLSPFFINYAWTSQAYDEVFYAATKKTYARLQTVAEKSGYSVARGALLYPNYAPADTPLGNMYGQNLAKLKALKRQVDPNNVMGLAGGFRL